MEALTFIGILLLTLLGIASFLFFLFGITDRIQGRSKNHTRWVSQTLPSVLWHAWLMGYGLIELIASRTDFAGRKKLRWERKVERNNLRYERRIETMDKLEGRN